MIDLGSALTAAVVVKLKTFEVLTDIVGPNITADIGGAEPLPPIVMVMVRSESKTVIGELDASEVELLVRIEDQGRDRSRLDTMVGTIRDGLDFDQDPDQERIVVEDMFPTDKPTSRYEDISGLWTVDLHYRAFVSKKEEDNDG